MTKKLLYEFLVIVIGVLTAFGVQEIAETLSENKQKTYYLKSVKSELTENSSTIAELIKSMDDKSVIADTLIHLLNNRISPDGTELFESFFRYSYLKFNLGAYEALKSSKIYNEIDNIELTTSLNNLIAQVQSTIEFQDKVEVLQMQLFIVKNNDVLDPVSRNILTDKAYSRHYVNDIKQIQVYRNALNGEFKDILVNINVVIELIDEELE